MLTKRTFAITTMLASIVVVAGLSTTAAYAQIFDLSSHQAGEPLHDTKLVMLNDQSGSIVASGQNPTCGVIDGVEGEWEIELDGKAAGLQSLFAASPNLFGHVELTVVGFATTAATKVGPTVITDDTVLDNFTDDICNIDKTDLGGLTCFACAFDEATNVINTNNFALGDDDTQIIDLVTDGNPTIGGNGTAERDNAIAAGYDSIVGLAIGNLTEVNPDSIAILTFPGVEPGPIFDASDVVNDPSILPDADDQGFVIVVDDFDGFAEAFLAKLFAEVEVCPPGTTGTFPDCKIVGGEFLPIDSTALLLAGMQSSAIWMLPILAGAASVTAFYIKTRMNKE